MMATASRADVALGEEIEAGRCELAEILRSLSPEAWDAPTLCAGWRVREVVAHMTMPFRYSTTRFLFEVIRDRGTFDRMADRCARRDGAVPTAELWGALRDNVQHPWKPPGGGLEGALVHDTIHGLDITVALGIERKIPLDRLRTVLDVVSRPKTLDHFGADLSGVELIADDMTWSWGSGTQVFGPAQDLALVLCGRNLPTGQLRGEASTRFVAV
jgi:uncharacterized protein (TIGR03083 family)